MTRLRRLIGLFVGAVFVASFVHPNQVHGQRCIDYGDYFGWLGDVQYTGGSAGDCAVAGAFMYVLTRQTAQTQLLSVLDISEPRRPTIAGGAEIPGQWNRTVVMAVSGTFVYVLTDFDLYAIDVSDPASPTVRGHVDFPNVTWDMAVSGEHLYLLRYDGASLVLEVMDASDPASPTVVGSVVTWEGSGVLAVAGSYVYVGSSYLPFPEYQFVGLQVVDVSNPASPALVGSVVTPQVSSIAVAGSYAYVGYDARLQLGVIDVSNPASPAVVDSVGLQEGPAGRIAIHGSGAYLTSSYALEVLEITNPIRPVTVGRFPFSAIYSAFSGATLYGLFSASQTSWGVHILDVANLASAPVVGHLDIPGEVGTTTLSGAHVYVAVDSTVQVVDRSNPEAPTALGSITTPGLVSGVAISGTHAYVADGSSGLQVIDVSSPTSPSLVGGIDTPGFAADVAILGTYAYVADGSSGLQVIDVSSPASPSLVGGIDTPGFAYEVALSGTHAYVADGSSGLQVIDVSSPTSPSPVGGIDTPSAALGVAISGAYAYVAEDLAGLQVIDISSPTSPSLIGGIDTPGGAADVAVLGTHAYVADGWSGLQVIDVSNPGSPFSVGGVGTPGYAGTLAVDCSGAYVGSAGLQILPIQAPCCPTSIDLSELSAYPRADGIELRWRLSGSGFVAFDVLRAEVSSSTEDQSYIRLGPAERAPSGEHVWEFLDTAAVPNRWYDYSIEGHLLDGSRVTFGPLRASRTPDTFATLRGVWPYPTHEHAVVAFSLPRQEEVRLEILDVAGRRVRLLLSQSRAAGEHRVTWDGRDDAGRKMASGTYFVRLEWRGGARSARVLLLH